jgi:hypothetical protein
MRTLIIAAFVALAVAGTADAKQCRDAHGKFMKCPPAAPVVHKPPVCKTGVVCGNTCIAATKVCHKP